MEPVTVPLQLSDEQAWALAQLLKRLGFGDCRGLAQDVSGKSLAPLLA